MNHRNQKLIAELRKILDSKSDQQVLQPYSSHNTEHRRDQEGTKVVQILPIGQECLKTSKLKFVPTTYTNIAQRNAKNARYLTLPTTPLATVEKSRLSPLFTPFVRPYDKKKSLKNYESLFSEKVRNEARLAFAFCAKKSVLVTISERLRKIWDVELSIRQEINEDKSCTTDSTTQHRPSAPTRVDLSQAAIDGNRNLYIAGLEEWLDQTLSSVEKNSSNYTETGSTASSTIDRRNQYSNDRDQYSNDRNQYSNVLNLDKKSSFCREIERTGLRLDRVADSKDKSFAKNQRQSNYTETGSSASANIDRRDLYLSGLNLDENNSFCCEIERTGLRLDNKNERFATSQGHLNYTETGSSTFDTIDRRDQYSNVFNLDKKSNFSRRLVRSGRVEDRRDESFVTSQGHSNYTETGLYTSATIDRRDKYSNRLNLDKKSSFCNEIERTGLRLNSKDESFATSQGHSNYTDTGLFTSANVDRRDQYSNVLMLDKKSSFCSGMERTGLRLDRVADSKDKSFATSQGHLDPTSWDFSQERIDDRINVENWFQDDLITPASSKQVHSLNHYAFSTNHPADDPKENELLFQTPPRNFNKFHNGGAEMNKPVDCATLAGPNFNTPNPGNWTSSGNSKSLLEEIFPEIELPPSFRATKPASFHRTKRIRSQTFCKNETDLSLQNFQTTNEVSWTIPAMETSSSLSISNSDNRNVGIFSQLESISNSQRGVSCRKRKLIDRTRDDDGICTVFSGATPLERKGNYNNINARLSVDSVIGNSFENMEYEWNFP